MNYLWQDHSDRSWLVKQRMDGLTALRCAGAVFQDQPSAIAVDTQPTSNPPPKHTHAILRTFLQHLKMSKM